MLNQNWGCKNIWKLIVTPNDVIVALRGHVHDVHLHVLAAAALHVRLVRQARLSFAATVVGGTEPALVIDQELVYLHQHIVDHKENGSYFEKEVSSEVLVHFRARPGYEVYRVTRVAGKLLLLFK